MRRMLISCPRCAHEYFVKQLQVISVCKCGAVLHVEPQRDYEAIFCSLEDLPTQLPDADYPYTEKPYTNDVGTRMLRCRELVHVKELDYVGFVSLEATRHGSGATSGDAVAFVRDEWIRLKTVLSVGPDGFLIPRTAIPIDIDFSKGFRLVYNAVHPDV